MEHALVGTDIMPAATHLTASVLSSTHPSVTFGNTSILTLPYGAQPDGSGLPIAIGALDLILEQQTLPLFGTGQTRLRGTGGDNGGHVDLPHDSFDLVIMNPPFTRPTNHEVAEVPVPSFAGFATSDDEMKHMSLRLKRLRQPSMVGHGNAGLASNFIDLAHAKVRSPDGVLALVLPASFLQGEAWSDARQLFDEHYRDVTVVSIATTGATACAFSADTGMAEVLVVATRRGDDEEAGRQVQFVNLFQRPQSILEAKSVARAVRHIPGDHPVGTVAIGDTERAGCSVRAALSETGFAGVREARLAHVAAGLVRGELKLPQRRDALTLPVVGLSELVIWH